MSLMLSAILLASTPELGQRRAMGKVGTSSAVSAVDRPCIPKQ